MITNTIALLALTQVVSAAGTGYGNNPSGSAEQNQATQLFLTQLNKSLAQNYLFALVALSAVVFMYNSAIRLNRHVRHLASFGGSQGPQKYFSRVSPVTAWLKSHLLLSPMLRHRRASPIKLTDHVNLGGLPTRLQAIFISFVVAYNIFACLWHVPWSSSHLQSLPVIRNRTGTIATVNLIPIIMMSTIKNPLITALDISYDSFNLMHRWLGRICVLQSIAHTACWTVGKVQQSGWPAVRNSITHSSFIYMGLLGTAAFTLILLHSFKLFRALAYEFFLYTHIVLVAGALAGLWYHLLDFPQLKYLIAAIAIWAATRSWRLSTLLYRSWCGGQACEATVEPLPGDAMRIEFTVARAWRNSPGQSVYFAIPSIGWFTLHPFSVAWSSSYTSTSIVDDDSNLQRSLSTKSNFSISDPEKAWARLPARPESVVIDVEAATPTSQTYSLIVKAHSGFTRRLLDRARKHNNLQRPLTLKALVEGPYGHSRSLASYGTVLLFASGVGITHQIPYVRDLVHQFGTGTSATKTVTLIWVIPSTEQLDWIRPWMHEVLGMDRRRAVLRVLLYISRATLQEEVRSPSETVRMSRGRPDVRRIMVEAARKREGCIAASVCAGGGLADEVRKCARLVVSMGVNVDFIEEGFGW